MIFTLLKHQFKNFFRSAGVNRGISSKIIIGIFALYFIGVSATIGIELKHFLPKIYPEYNIQYAFLIVVMYFFAIDIFLRFLWQDLSAMAVQPYLLQNIKRNQLIQFLNIKSLFSILNVIPFFLFVPFVLNVFGAQQNYSTAGFVLFFIVLMDIGNHFLVQFIKRKTSNTKWLLGFMAIIILFAALKYFHVINLHPIGATIFKNIQLHPWILLFAVAYPIFTYWINNRLLKQTFYFEESNNSIQIDRLSKNGLFQKIAANNELIDLDIKLIFRNKRARSTITITLVFLFYGFMIFKKGALDKSTAGFASSLIWAFMIVGMIALNYGQFLFAWQSNYFDSLMTRKISTHNFIKSKFQLLQIFCTISFLLSLIYGFIDYKLIFVLFMSYFFAIGVIPVFSSWLAMGHYNSLDISKSSSFNFQGTGATQWIFTFGILLIAVLIILPFLLFHQRWMGAGALGAFGLVNFLLQNWWINILSKKFKKNKYKILDGFREK